MLFLKAVIVGVSVSAPLGPIGFLCIQKTLSKGIRNGLGSAMGATLADTLYAILAGFGLSFVSDFLTDNQLILRIAGSFLLIGLGIKIYFTNTVRQYRKRQRSKNKNIIGDFLSVFALTLSNPLTILFFGAVFAGMGFVADESPMLSSLVLTAGVFTGSLLWWVTLTLIVSLFRKRITLRNLWWINKISGVLISLFGVILLFSISFLKI